MLQLLRNTHRAHDATRQIVRATGKTFAMIPEVVVAEK